jgi:hypothetical protein
MYEIIAAQSNGKLETINTNIFINSPIVQQYYSILNSLSS